ncbi:MAG: AMP nucleosidase, partial [Comamonas sp.]
MTHTPLQAHPHTAAMAVFSQAQDAVEHLQTLYRQQIERLRSAMRAYVEGQALEHPVRACYPLLRIQAHSVRRPETSLAYGFLDHPGVYETTITRPDLFANYLHTQLQLLERNHAVHFEVGLSNQPIPIHFSFADSDHVEGSLSASRRHMMREVFDLPDLAAMDDGIANGTWQPQAGDALPLSLFTAPRIDYSLHRLRHYTGTAPEWFQNYVLFTNYQFYIDEFIRLGHAEMAKPDSEYIAFIEPGNVVTRRSGLPAQDVDALGSLPARLPQMPAYHLVRADRSGITM